MSTINEALRKAQEQKSHKQEELILPVTEKEQPFEPQPSESQAETSTTKVRRPRRNTSLLIIVVFLIISIVVFVFSFNANKSLVKDDIEEAVVIKDSTQVENQPAVAEQPATPLEKIADAIIQKPKTPRFTLTGIMYDQKNPMAIINNEIVVEGQRIENATVSRISNNKVVIFSEGQEIELEVAK